MEWNVDLIADSYLSSDKHFLRFGYMSICGMQQVISKRTHLQNEINEQR